jgi:hypothetical protein
MRSNEQFFIFSVYQSNKSRTDNEKESNFIFWKLSNAGIPFKQVDGCYLGEREESFLVPAKYEKEIMEIAKAYNQESVLFVDSKRRGHLIYLEDNKTINLGTLQKVSDEQASNLEAYTYDPTTKSYWAVI